MRAGTGEGGGRRGLLVTGGEAPPAAVLRAEARVADLVVAADSGLDRLAEAGIEPGLVVGDMDSLARLSLLATLPPDRVIAYPVDKDETDTEIGLRILRERGCTLLTIAGGGGGRLDHLLGIAALFERPEPPSRWITATDDTRLVMDTIELEVGEGATVSVLPVGDVASRTSSTGLKWPLDGLEFRRGWGGISNVATSSSIRVSVGRGRLLVILSLARNL